MEVSKSFLSEMEMKYAKASLNELRILQWLIKNELDRRSFYEKSQRCRLKEVEK